MSTKIEWTEETWNPVTGCTKISPGCRHCYAERMATRLAGRVGYPDVTLRPDKLNQPLRWRKPRRIFVCSMGDLFHESVPDYYIAAVFGVMAACTQHTFQVLTKRPERALEWFRWIDSMAKNTSRFVHGHMHVTNLFTMTTLATDTTKWRDRYDRSFGEQIGPERWPLPNVWVGVTAEDQQRADERIPLLLEIQAAVRFVSVEPMLGAVDLVYSAYTGAESVSAMGGLDWVICGCETGPGARPMHPDWARGLRDQCQAAGVPFFLKKVDPSGGRLLDGRTWDEYPGMGE